MEAWYFLVILSSVMMGIATVIEKTMLKAEHATQYSTALTPLVTILSLVFIPWANFQLSVTQLALIIVLSAVNAYGFLLVARIFKHSELSIASPVMSSLVPLLVVIFAFIFLSETLSVLQYAVIIGMVITIYFLLFGRGARRAPSIGSNKYLYLLILYCVLSASTSIMGKYLLIGMNPFTFLILSGVFMSIFFTIMISVRYGGVREIFNNMKRYKLPLMTNAILTVGYRASYFIALTVAPVSIAQPLRNTVYVVITVAFSGLLFKEQQIARKLSLGLLLLVFAYLLTINM
ncbi:MAG: EamA family transporter [Candidatus Marsarchaeota archaeon]|nr:EamA family transporter [Candidatus Marsarchaeota archaeon]